MANKKNKKWTYEVPHASDWPKVVQDLLKKSKEVTTWCFEGELGAGKTTCIQALCATLGVEEAVTSPTFSLVNTYQTKQKHTIYHIDCYRIENSQDLAEIGIEYYLHTKEYLLVEWPKKIYPYIVHPYLLLHITSLPEAGRKVVVTLVKPNQS